MQPDQHLFSNSAEPPHEHAQQLPDRRQVLTGLVTLGVLARGTENTAAATPPVSDSPRSRRQSCDTVRKQIACNDYRQSLARHGGQLSTPIRQLFLTAQSGLAPHFAVLVIGSGYGASICAARLSQKLRPGLRIGVLERGREWLPGEFPDTFPDVWNNSRQQITGPTQGQVTNPLGLFNLGFNPEVNVLSGSGLGGTSLINAGIALRPHSETFERDAWPAALRSIDFLTPYYNRAAQQLCLTRPPLDATAKLRIRRQTAQVLSNDPLTFDRSPISVMCDQRYLDANGLNPQGMKQQLCTQCGDCITGCNVGAKNTLAYNYLPVARANGTEIYTQVEVRRIERESGYYRVHLEYLSDEDGKITRHPLTVTSQLVILGAGSPGSAEILLQSQTDCFAFSGQLGKKWSSNGDALGFVIDRCERAGIAGFGACDPPCEPVGTTLQSTLNFFNLPGLDQKFIIQDAAIPRGVANLFSVLLNDRELQHSMVMLGMGHDEARGELVWKDGRYQISWPGMKTSPLRQKMFQEFERLAAAEGGRYKRLKAFGDNMVTVHPLGGCALADTPCGGVVNDRGEVFDPTGYGCEAHSNEAPVHPGLYVADASIIPTSLGANPYLTICALAERIAELIPFSPHAAELFIA